MERRVTERPILVLGAAGQVGRELPSALAELGRVIALDRSGVDLRDADALRELVRTMRPRLIVNAAAYTAVDAAESEAELAELVNGAAPGVLAEEAENIGAALVHYSTEYVFDGLQERPYVETDEPNPLSAYGRSKWHGEQRVVAACSRHLIFRTSWVLSAQGRNFLKTILRYAEERDVLQVVRDQRGAPTWARLIAEVTAVALRQLDGGRASDTRWGTYHLAASGSTTWYDYACYIIEGSHGRGAPLRTGADAVTPILARDYPSAAARPANSMLDTAKLRDTFSLQLPDWQDGVNRVLDQLLVGHLQ